MRPARAPGGSLPRSTQSSNGPARLTMQRIIAGERARNRTASSAFTFAMISAMLAPSNRGQGIAAGTRTKPPPPSVDVVYRTSRCRVANIGSRDVGQPSGAQEKLFKAGMWLKGINGTLELIGGVLLLAIPHSLSNRVVAGLVDYATGYGMTSKIYQEVSLGVARLDVGFSFPVFYLLSHGVVKLFLAIALLRDLRWAYPVSLGIFGLLLVYEGVRFAEHASIPLGLVILIDLVILTLIWRHWRRDAKPSKARKRKKAVCCMWP